MIFAPYFISPLTDFSFWMVPNSYQASPNPLCAKLELRFLDCFEAHGAARVREKCAELLYDLSECNQGHFQKLRAKAIRDERMRQYRAGKLSTPFVKYPNLEAFLF